jgi:putative transposase
MAFGPGSLYQIDATIASTYLVSSLDHISIIGRPVVYFVIDVFSRMIVGIAVTLEGPSWWCAMLAVENIVEDKVEFCRKYGIIIDASEWPCQRLGNGFLADRGEFEGYSPEPLIKNCRQTVQNTPPYCGEFKAIIERNNGRAEERTIRFIPGYVLKDRRPGEPDYRLEAAVTMYTFTRSIIRYVLWYNNNHYLKKYNMKEFAIQDKVARYPIDLWDWGIKNRSGNFGLIHRDVLRKNLLPHKEVSITPNGIYFGNGLYYTCETAMRERWFDRARERGRWKEVASYKLDSVDNIYLWLDCGNVMEECFLLDRLADPFIGKSRYEVDDYQKRQLADEEASHTRRQQSLATLQAQNEREFAEEVEKTNAALEVAGPTSKRSRIRGIRANRQKEKELERQRITTNALHACESDKTAINTITEQQPHPQQPDSYVPPAEDLDELSALREEAWNAES